MTAIWSYSCHSNSYPFHWPYMVIGPMWMRRTFSSVLRYSEEDTGLLRLHRRWLPGGWNNSQSLDGCLGSDLGIWELSFSWCVTFARRAMREGVFAFGEDRGAKEFGFLSGDFQSWWSFQTLSYPSDLVYGLSTYRSSSVSSAYRTSWTPTGTTASRIWLYPKL